MSHWTRRYTASASLYYLLLGLLMCSNVYAEWIPVKVSVVLQAGQLDQAREQAKEQAIEKAKVQYRSLQLEALDVGQNGLSLAHSSHVQVNGIEVTHESLWSNRLFVEAQVDVAITQQLPMCDSGIANAYKKSLAVMGFSLQVPQEAAVGDIQNVGSGLAHSLRETLSNDRALVVMADSSRGLYERAAQAPTRYHKEASLTNSIEAASALGVQFLISGVVRDMGLYDTGQSVDRSYWQRIKRMAGKVDDRRRFAIDIFIHDGLTGAIISQNRFSTVADWNIQSDAPMRFGSMAFWQTEYGKAIAIMLQDVRHEISEQIRCQPFMARIARVDGKTLHFSAGALAGIKPGDRLQVYRTQSFFDANMSEGMELKNVRTILTVSQVHPEFSSGKIGIEPQRINIQEDDLVVAW